MSDRAATVEVSGTPTLDTSAYADGDRMGSIVELDVKNDAVTLLNVEVLDKADQGANFDILFFKSSPTVASSDNAALSITDSEAEKCLGVVSIETWKDLGGNQMGYARNVGLGLMPESGGKLYMLLQSRGTPTYAAASLTLRFYFAVDGE